MDCGTLCCMVLVENVVFPPLLFQTNIHASIDHKMWVWLWVWLVALCLYVCILPQSISGNNELCRTSNREGQFCGRCKKSTGPAVYSYSLECVPCLETEFKFNLFKYVAVAFLPSTIFYLGACHVQVICYIR